MGPYGGLSLRGGQQAALPLIGTWNLELGVAKAGSATFTADVRS